MTDETNHTTRVCRQSTLAYNRSANRTPGFPVYATVIDQLKYIRAVFDGTEKDKSKLHRLTIGAIAAKEFESTDEALAEALFHVYYIAEQSANGLKIRLPGEK